MPVEDRRLRSRWGDGIVLVMGTGRQCQRDIVFGGSGYDGVGDGQVHCRVGCCRESPLELPVQGSGHWMLQCESGAPSEVHM